MKKARKLSLLLLSLGLFLISLKFLEKSEFDGSSLLILYQRKWESFQNKVSDLRHLHETNERLTLENAELKYRYQTAQFDCEAKVAKKGVMETEKKLKLETGSPTGRAIASLTYTVPTQLSLSQLMMLGSLYFKNKDYEKSAAIFTSLLESEDQETYKTPRNLILTGVSWFRIENLKWAEHYFDEVIKMKLSEADLPYQAQARLWKALVAKKLQKDLKAQFWLRDLIDHHPHSMEASWINRARPLND